MRAEAKTVFARALRRDETLAEKRLWEQLRSRKFEGLKFVRQATVGPYIADFLCREKRFIIEVDGATHSTSTELANDKQRSAALQTLGYRVFRTDNDEVIHGMDEVLNKLHEAMQA